MMRWILAVAVLSQAVGCSSSGTNGDNHADAGASLDSLTRAYCSAARTCCAAIGAPAQPLDTCETEFVRQINFYRYVDKGTVVVDETALAGCVTALERVATSCLLRDFSCQPFTSGTVADGAPCENVEECSGRGARPTACFKPNIPLDGGTSIGTCVAVAVGKEGDPCTMSCLKGDTCSLTYSTTQSIRPLTTCREEDGLYCTSLGCAPFPPDDAPCPEGLCASTSYCDTVDTVCKPRKAEGSACASPIECAAGMRCVSGSCATATFATPKLCKGDLD